MELRSPNLGKTAQLRCEGVSNSEIAGVEKKYSIISGRWMGTVVIRPTKIALLFSMGTFTLLVGYGESHLSSRFYMSKPTQRRGRLQSRKVCV